jgi:hypothetical protein
VVQAASADEINQLAAEATVIIALAGAGDGVKAGDFCGGKHVFILWKTYENMGINEVNL